MSKQFKATAFSYPAVYALNGFGNTEKKMGRRKKSIDQTYQKPTRRYKGQIEIPWQF